MTSNDQGLPAQEVARLEHADDLTWSLYSLAELAGNSSGTLSDISLELSETRAERIRWHVVRERDKGEVKVAQRIFEFLHESSPDHAGFLIELLVINVLFEPRADRMQVLVKKLWPRPWLPSQAALLVAFDAARANDMDTARHFWPHVDKAAENEGPFKSLFRETISAIELADLDGQERIVAFLTQAAELGDLRNAIRQAAFINRFSLINPIEATASALIAARPGFDTRAVAESMAFFSATRQDAVFDELYAGLADDPAAWSTPQFAKWSCLHAIRNADAAKEAEALERYASAPRIDGLPSYSIPAAQDEELRARYNAPYFEPASTHTSRTRNVFVGLFGQLRTYKETLPKLVAYIRNDLAGANNDYHTTFGVATWDKVGGRALSIHDGIGFFRELIPLELHDFLERSGVKDGTSLLRIAPNVTQRLIDLSGQSDNPASPEEILTYLPEGAAVRVDTDSSFQAEIKRELPEKLPDMAAHYLRGNMNQLRMWSRIAVLGDLIKERERLQGHAFDQVVLLRSDLLLHGGSIADLIAESAAFPGAVLYDFDPHADYIEGMGDRYIVASRDAIESLFGCFNWLIGKLQTSSPTLIRLNPHEGASSVLFTTRRQLRPKTSIMYELHRGRFSIDHVRDAVLADADLGAEGIASRVLDSVLPTLQ